MALSKRLRRLSTWKIHPKCPSVYELYRSAPKDYRLFKAAIGFPIGAALGLAFHFAVINRLRIPVYAQYGISGMFLAFLAVGFAASAPVRCMVLLVLPTLGGKAGRSYIGTFALAFLLTGPVANIMKNAAEVTRSVRCSMEVAENLTSSRADLRFRPMKEIMRDLLRQGKDMSNTTKQVKGQFMPVELEVEDEKEIEKLKAQNDEVDNLNGGKVSRSQLIDERHRKAKVNTKGGQKANKYERKLDYRCEDVFSLGFKQCRKFFHETEMKCMHDLGIFGGAACWPLKITVLCELVKLASGIGLSCDSETAVNEGFGDGYQTAVEAGKDLDKNFDVNMQYRVVKAEEQVDMVTPEEVSKGIAYEFDSRMIWVKFTMKLINTITTFLFMRVVFTSFKYHQKYVSDFKFDNIYITAYFRHIDLRRRKQKKRTLLPLKKTEKKEVIFPTSRSMSASEIKKMVAPVKTVNSKTFGGKNGQSLRLELDVEDTRNNSKIQVTIFDEGAQLAVEVGSPIFVQDSPVYKNLTFGSKFMSVFNADNVVVSRTIRLLVQVFTYTIVILIDRLLFECMDIIQRHSRIDYRQTGSHEISLIVYGNGVMGNVVRTLLQGFNKKHAINDLSSNAPCLPDPSKVPNTSLMKIGAIFAVMWVLVVVEAFMLRLRRLVACIFYPKREKKRILHLYNGMLKRRKGFLRHTRHQVRRNARERKLKVKTSMLTSLSRQFPLFRGLFRRLKMGSRKCLVCEESEKKKGKYVSCKTPGCRFVYCKECWVDVHRKCYACRRKDDWSSDSSSD